MKIDRYDVRIRVSGVLEAGERHVININKAALRMLATGWELELLPSPGGWQARYIKITGVLLNADLEPTRTARTYAYWLSEPDTPQWVHNIVAACTPKQTSPRPRGGMRLASEAARGGGSS